MSLRSTMAAALQRYLADPRIPSARVLPAAGLAIEVTGSDGSRVTYTFDPRRAVVELTPTQVLIWRDSQDRIEQGVGTKGPVAHAWTFTSERSAELERLYEDVLKALRGTSRVSRLKPILVGALVGVAILAVGGPKAPAAAVPNAIAAVPGQLVPPSGVTAAPTPAQAVVSSEEAKLVAGLKGVKLPGSGATYYVFSDPNCPFCKELEKAVEVVSGYQPVVLPLGYKNGSRDLSAAVMCSADPAKEWARAIVGTSAAKPCEKGYQMVDANMQVFEKLGLSSTPTMVTPKGTLVTGAANPDELRAVLQR